MAEFSEIQQVSTMADADTFVITVGAKSRQLSKSDLESSLSVSGTFADVIDSLAADYALVPQSTSPITQVLMNADNGASGQVTIPNSTNFVLGAMYVVTNQGASTDLDIVLGTGVTCGLIASGSDYIPSKTAGDASYVTFVNVGPNDWVCYGDVDSPA
jgi:hypothetical protein